MMIVATAKETLTGQVAQALSNTRGSALVLLNKNETIQVCCRVKCFNQKNPGRIYSSFNTFVTINSCYEFI